MDDPYRLDRFVEAQDDLGTFDRAVDELRRGRKTGHWMWFIFPQIAGLGFSAMAERYAIATLAEARAYLRHGVLGERLKLCAEIVADAQTSDAEAIFGTIDTLKLRSSMTLFHRAAPDELAFSRVLERFFDGTPDPATDRLLSTSG